MPEYQQDVQDCCNHPPLPPRPKSHGTENPDTGRRLLAAKGFTLTIPSERATEAHVREVHGEVAWRYRAVRFWHSNPVQLTMCFLLLLDETILLIEMYLLAAFPFCYIVVRDAISCFPSGCSSFSGEAAQWLDSTALEEEDHTDICPLGTEPNFTYQAGCDPHRWQAVHTAGFAMFILSMTIMIVFMAELLTLMTALHPSVFFRQFFYALDFFMVTITIALETTFYTLEEEILQTMIGVLILTRIWRIVRIGRGVVDLTSSVADQRYQELLTYTESLEQLLQRQGIDIPPSIQTLQQSNASSAYTSKLPVSGGAISHKQQS